jgi:hypothetical protein
MYEIKDVQARGRFKVWLRFEDGVEGEVDLSDVAGKGVFAAWLEDGVFEKVFIDREAGTIAWPGGIDVAPDVLYQEITQVQTR